MSSLHTAAEVAEEFGITEKDLHKLRNQHGWPCVKLGRFNVRFTDEQVEQIVAQMTVAPEKTKGPAKVPGQTARSASRKRSA